MNLIMEHEIGVRLGFFIGILVLMAIWEALAPRRQLTVSKMSRWSSNLGLAAGMAILAEERSWGLLNNVVLPHWVSVVAAVLVLDLAIYLQHVMFHAVPVLWRLHMVHHADLDIDVTTGTRFHTIEIFLSMGIKLAVVLVLGPPAVAVIVFELLLNATAMFNHGNVHLPTGLDRLLRLLVVTPDMHRVHHSVVPRETNSNFGFNLPWWDRLLGTYRSQPAAGHEGMTIGLSQFRDTRVARLQWMLVLPFIGQIGSYPMSQREERRR
jgi:sterol desaturase/sphingolipid hydroxylase (fatty acid hydroxylase superfamily)